MCDGALLDLPIYLSKCFCHCSLNHSCLKQAQRLDSGGVKYSTHGLVIVCQFHFRLGLNSFLICEIINLYIDDFYFQIIFHS